MQLVVCSSAVASERVEVTGRRQEASVSTRDNKRAGWIDIKHGDGHRRTVWKFGRHLSSPLANPSTNLRIEKLSTHFLTNKP
jgi:predicted transcriptional regulator